MFNLIIHAVAHCHQVPSPTVVMHRLGLFYYWHIWNVTGNAGRIVCKGA